MKQLFANNAKSTLSASITSSDLQIQVADVSRFPVLGQYEYFLATIEVGSQMEIIRVTSVSGNNFYCASVTDRGFEGTSASSFPVGARIECRVTRDTLARFSTNLAQVSSVNVLKPPRDSENSGYICSTFDPSGNPVIAVQKDDILWRFLNYTPVQYQAATGTTTTSLTGPALVANFTFSPGELLVQITSGVHAGTVRVITAVSSNTISWSGAITPAPVNGTTYEIVRANSSILLDINQVSDDAVVMPLILGGL